MLRTSKSWYMLDPEVQRCYWALCMEARRQGKDYGFGTGWRSYAQQLANWQQDPQRFAHPGGSYHTDCVHGGYAAAIDVISGDGNQWLKSVCASPALANWSAGMAPILTQRSPFGLRLARSDESWHIQWVTFPKARSPRGSFRSIQHWDIPGEQPPPPPDPPPTMPDFNPSGRIYGLWPLVPDKRYLNEGGEGDDVWYAKGVLFWEVSRFADWFLASGQADSPARVGYLIACRDECRLIDGSHKHFDAQFRKCVEFMQRAFAETRYDGRLVGGMNLRVGEINDSTWAFIDSVSDGIWL